MRALAGLGDAQAARRVRDEAWRAYVSLPRFHSRHERPFPWRLEPWRPAVVLALVVLTAVVASYWALPSLFNGASL